MSDKNYITPKGFRELQRELKFLKVTERPEVTATVAWAASNGDRSENADYTYGKKRLREIDRKIRFLSKQIDNAEIIDPAKVSSNLVQFGATVTFADEEGVEKTFQIVGVDECEVSEGTISWKSPLARALLKKGEGDWVQFKAPKGEQELEIIKIEYR